MWYIVQDLPIPKPLEETTERIGHFTECSRKGQFWNLAKQAVAIFTQAKLWAVISLSIAPGKTVLFSGPNNVGYGNCLSSTTHMARLFGRELGGIRIRVNTINPDGSFVGQLRFGGDWGRRSAPKLTEFYRRRTPCTIYAKRKLLNEIIYPRGYCKRLFSLLLPFLEKTNW